MTLNNHTIPEIKFYYNGKLILDNHSLPLKVKSTKNFLIKLSPLKKGTLPDKREIFYNQHPNYEDSCYVSDLRKINDFNFYGLESKKFMFN